MVLQDSEPRYILLFCPSHCASRHAEVGSAPFRLRPLGVRVCIPYPGRVCLVPFRFPPPSKAIVCPCPIPIKKLILNAMVMNAKVAKMCLLPTGAGLCPPVLKEEGCGFSRLKPG